MPAAADGMAGHPEDGQNDADEQHDDADGPGNGDVRDEPDDEQDNAEDYQRWLLAGVATRQPSPPVAYLSCGEVRAKPRCICRGLVQHLQLPLGWPKSQGKPGHNDRLLQYLRVILPAVASAGLLQTLVATGPYRAPRRRTAGVFSCLETESRPSTVLSPGRARLRAGAVHDRHGTGCTGRRCSPSATRALVAEITRRAAVVSGLAAEQPRYYPQHAFNFQVHDERHPHHPRRHGRADTGWKAAPEDD